MPSRGSTPPEDSTGSHIMPGVRRRIFSAEGAHDDLGDPIRSNVCFGSLADMLGCMKSVRSTPKSRHSMEWLTLSAKCQKQTFVRMPALPTFLPTTKET